MSAARLRPSGFVPSGTRTRRAWLGAALACVGVAPLVAADDAAFSIELQGDRRGQETFERTFAAVLSDRSRRDDLQSYQPAVAGAPIVWEGPVEPHWDLGDGGPPVSTGERASASHVYERDGRFVVTVTAGDRRGVFATDSLEIEVTNRPPRSRHLAAIEIDPAASTVELTATAQGAAEDELHFAWEFGDGETAAGPAEELWRDRHRYPGPGRWEVRLTITDSDGAERVETKAVRVLGADSGAGAEREQIGDEPPVEAVVTRFAGSVRGAVAADLDAGVRPMRGLYLQRVDSGACRFMFTAWDDADLVSLHAVVDLFGVPPEGARYRIERPQVALVFSPDARHYDYRRLRAAAVRDRVDLAAAGHRAPGARAPARPGRLLRSH